MMIKILYIVAFGFGTIAVHHGCATESKTVASHDNGHGGTSCGSNVCTGQTFCCNASCGICAPIGGFCTQQLCLTPEVSKNDTNASAPEAKGDRSIDPART